MKNLFLSVSFLLLPLLHYSQDSKIKFGVQAGLNYSTFYGYTLPADFGALYSESAAFAFLGGIHLEYKIKDRLGLKVEVNYERKSQKADNNIEIRDTDGFGKSYNFTSRKNYDYIVLPILIKYSFRDKNSFYLNGGPYIGYLLKSTITNDLERIEGFNEGPDDTTNFNKKTDFGLSIGLGKTIGINEKSAIFIEIRENLGLINTSKTKVWGDGTAKTNSVSLIVGYSMN